MGRGEGESEEYKAMVGVQEVFAGVDEESQSDSRDDEGREEGGRERYRCRYSAAQRVEGTEEAEAVTMWYAIHYLASFFLI